MTRSLLVAALALTSLLVLAALLPLLLPSTLLLRFARAIPPIIGLRRGSFLPDRRRPGRLLLLLDRRHGLRSWSLLLDCGNGLGSRRGCPGALAILVLLSALGRLRPRVLTLDGRSCRGSRRR